MGAESGLTIDFGDLEHVEDLPRQLRLAAASVPIIELEISDELARELARAIETGLTAAADQKRILAKAEVAQLKASAALAQAEVTRGMAKAALERAEGKLRMAFWFDVAAFVVVAAFLLVGAGF